MQKKKVTIRVPIDLLENGKRYAAQNNTTLSNLIEAYFRQILDEPPFENAPIVRRLSGILSQETKLEDYHQHIEEKYG